jgi:hypothetical protein
MFFHAFQGPGSQSRVLLRQDLTHNRRQFWIVFLDALPPASQSGRVLGRDPLAQDSSRLVDAHLRNLRSKLRAVDPQGDWIRAVRGIGYRLD